MARITVARSTIGRGLAELRGDDDRPGGPGAPARRRTQALVSKDPSLLDDLQGLVEPATRGDPQAPLLWTAKSLRKLAAELRAGPPHRPQRGRRSAAQLDYSLQPTARPARERHPDRDAQFDYINEQVKQALAAGEPAISVDTKKKELVGDFKNGGRDCRPKASPRRCACTTS